MEEYADLIDVPQLSIFIGGSGTFRSLDELIGVEPLSEENFDPSECGYQGKISREAKVAGMIWGHITFECWLVYKNVRLAPYAQQSSRRSHLLFGLDSPIFVYPYFVLEFMPHFKWISAPAAHLPSSPFFSERHSDLEINKRRSYINMTHELAEEKRHKEMKSKKTR